MANPRPSAGAAAGIARAWPRPRTLFVRLPEEVHIWLGWRARDLNAALGTQTITPAHIAHQLLHEALQAWRVSLFRGAK